MSSKVIHLGKGQENVMFLETSVKQKNKITNLVTLVEKHFRSIQITASRIGVYQPVYCDCNKIFFSVESIKGDLSADRIKSIRQFCTRKWDSL
jgi:hypothetical protein